VENLLKRAKTKEINTPVKDVDNITSIMIILGNYPNIIFSILSIISLTFRSVDNFPETTLAA
jgi:hypothetical protein